MRLGLFVFLSIGCWTAATAFAGQSSTTVVLSEIPVAARNAIQARVGDGKLGSIEKTSQGGEIVYDVGLTAGNGQERDFTVADDGTLLSVEVTLAETPAAVQKSIQTLAKSGKLESIDKEMDGSDTTYDIGLKGSTGTDEGFVIDDDGALLSREIALPEAPEAVRKTVQAELGSGQLKSISKMFDAEGVTYDVEAGGGGDQEKAFTVAEDGKLVSRRMTLAEVPPPARRTITEHLGDGKILRIDRSYIETKGVMPYEVQGRKDGKPFDFSVGPRGRFLGMNN